jgi:uncharacterized membrane protein
MEKRVQLSRNEKRQQTILLIIFIGVILVIVKGILNQSNHIDQDHILFPIFLIQSCIFCIVYSVNAFTTGNLVRKWGSHALFNFISDQVKNNKQSITDERAEKITAKIFGVFTGILAALAIATFIQSLHTGKW